MKLVKNQAKANQHPEAELLLTENYLFFSSTLTSKNNIRYSKKCTKNKQVCFNEVIWLITMKVRLKKSRSYKCNINRPKNRHEQEYTKYKMCLNMMVIGNKQHQSNIWSSIHEKVKKNWSWVKKGVV